MKTKGLLLSLQEPANGPYLRPDESSPHLKTLFKTHFDIILKFMPISP
jgi:hypothetical protein